MHLTHPKYRADIDGLRAVAILSVVGYHAFPGWIKGGFVGVDVFFVISGFLISTIIFGSLTKDAFSFREFYSRRIKRIFPALTLVMASCYTLGWFVLFPDEYKQLGKHIIAGAGFVSNLFLWQEAGYFDNTAETKPMLHLWSLGIEEQFYIVWPLLLYLTWKRRFNLLLLTVAIIAISFADNVVKVHSDAVQAFYSPVSRFWELMIGSILAYLALHKLSLWNWAKQKIGATSSIASAQDSLALRNAQSIIGSLLIAIAVLVVNKEKAFPGWWVLLPTFGAYLIISAGQHSWLNRTVLSHRVMVWFGLISYPFYLWHWPLLSFARIIEGKTPSPEMRIVVVIISIALAWLTFILVEKPIRFGNQGKVISTTLIILMALVGFTGYITFQKNGLAFRQIALDTSIVNGLTQDGLQEEAARFPQGFVPFHCPAEIKMALPFLNFCKTSAEHAPTAALVGDSHADHLFPGIPNHDISNRWILLGVHSCPPTIGIFAEGSNPGCAEKVGALFNYLVQNRNIKLVALSFYGQYAAETNYNADAIQRGRGAQQYILKSDYTTNKAEALYFGLDNSIKVLMNSGKQVIVMLDVPELPFFPRDCIRRGVDLSSKCSIPRMAMENRQAIIRGVVERLKERYPDILVYDPANLLCTAERCYAFDHGRSYYRDSHHLSALGSDLVGQNFNKWLVSQNMHTQ